MRRSLLCGLAIAGSLACERVGRDGGAVDTAVIDTIATVDTMEPPPELPAWLRDLGPYVLVPGDSPSEAVVIALEGPADTAAMPKAGEAMTLIGPVGVERPGRITRVPPHADSARCDVWPVAELRSGDHDVLPWSFAVRPGRAKAVRVDTLAAVSSRDSASIVAALARSASTLPDDTARAFQGLPFVVRNAWRFTPAGGSRMILADIERRINVEADPRTERIAVLARESSPGALEPLWHERDVGREETVPATDLLAVLDVQGRLAVVLARLDDTGSVYLILEREGPGRWVTRWTSADRC